MSDWSRHDIAAAIYLVCAVLFIWHAPILKPYFGFRKPRL